MVKSKLTKLLSSFQLMIFLFVANSLLIAQEYSIENEAIKRIIKVDKSVQTIKLINKSTGREYSTNSDEFQIMIDDYNADFSGKILSAKDFELDGKVNIITENKKISIPLINKETGIKVNLFFEADGKFYMHKWLEFSIQKGKHNISTVEVERILINGVQKSRPSLALDKNTENDGPVIADDFFLGLEFPKQDNSFDGEYIRLKHFPGTDITAEKNLLSKKSVLGAAANKPLQRVKDKFLQYIDEYRGSPVKNFKVYNTWFLLVFDQKEDKLIKAIETHIKPLYDRGIKLDGYVVDDGWQDKNTLWEVNKTNLPSGLDPDSKIQQELKKYGTDLHLWLPLTGQYGIGEQRKDSNWYEKRGYETGTNWCLCLAPGNKIYTDKKKRLLELVKLGVTSFKADFALLGCNKKGHNHLANKYYGMEANINGIIDIIESLKKENPDLIYYLTTDINKNPWWLKTNDLLWESFWDDIKYYTGNQEPTPAQVRMSGRDDWHWKNNMKWFVPQTSYMTHGIIASNNPEDELYCSIQEMIDIAILYYARGVMWSEIYVTDMNKEYWDILAEVIKWSDANWKILTQQPYMSGGPSGKAPYYWSHFLEDEGLIIVRNPTGKRRGINIPLNETSRIKEFNDRIYQAEIVKISEKSNIKEVIVGNYKYNDNVNIVLEPWQLKVVKISPAKNANVTFNLNTSEINLGIVNLNKSDELNSIQSKIELRNCSNLKMVKVTSESKWIKINPVKENQNAITFGINSESLEYNKLYTGEINVEMKDGDKIQKRTCIVVLKTNRDPNEKVIYLSELEALTAKQDYGSLCIDKSVGGNKLSVNGIKYEKGLGTHSNSVIEYDIKEFNAKRFQAKVGHDDETKGTIDFKVFLDKGNGYDKSPAFSTSVMRNGDQAKEIDIDITGIAKIKLVVGNNNDGINGDHADWIEARILR